MSRRSRRSAGGVVVMLVVAAACSSAATPTTSAPPPTSASTTKPPDTTATVTTPTAPTTTEPPSPPAPGPLGQIVVAPGEAIQIRSLQAVTGAVAFLGLPNHRGTELAVEDYGPIEGHPVDLGAPLDDGCSSEQARNAAQTIVADRSVVGVIGASCPDATRAASPLISSAGMVMISPSSVLPALTSDLRGNAGSDYHPGFYRTANNDLFQGVAVARFLYEELGLRSVAAVHDGTAYTNDLADAMAGSFEALGGEATVGAVQVGDTDTSSVLSEVADVDPEAIYLAVEQPEGAALTEQVGGVAGLEDVILVGSVLLLTDDFLSRPESVGMYFSGPDHRFDGNTSATGVGEADLLTRYQMAYGEVPSAPFWAHSYDATTMLLSAVDEVGVDFEGSLYIDRQALRDALSATSDLDGITGSIACDEFGDCGAQRLSVVLHAGDVDLTRSNVVYAATRADLIDLVAG